MHNQLVLELRERIDAKHREALAALDKLAAYLEEIAVSHRTNGMDVADGLQRLLPLGQVVATDLSIRGRVLNVLRHGDATVASIAERTRLEKRQVRGVVNAPDMRGKIISDQRDDTTYYTLADSDDG